MGCVNRGVALGSLIRSRSLGDIGTNQEPLPLQTPPHRSQISRPSFFPISNLFSFSSCIFCVVKPCMIKTTANHHQEPYLDILIHLYIPTLHNCNRCIVRIGGAKERRESEEGIEWLACIGRCVEVLSRWGVIIQCKAK